MRGMIPAKTRRRRRPVLTDLPADVPQVDEELRSEEEVTHVFGQQIAASDTVTYNPSFDVTPSALIKGIFTERGVIEQPYLKSISEALTS